MTLSRAASLLVAVGYVIAAIVATEGRDGRVWLLGVTLLAPLALIWFPDVFGSYLGPVGRGRHVDRETPPVLIAMAGWFFLVGMPAILYFIGRSRG
jgi:hypothetical protein